MDIAYNSSSVLSLIEKSNIPYLSPKCLEKNYRVSTPLTNDENVKISKYLYNLGKSDIESQITNLKCFEQYVLELKNKYEGIYNSKSKLYLSVSLSTGIVISLVLI